MALEIGAAYITIIPSTRGMIKEIKRSLNEDGGKAATRAGRDMGRNISKGIGDEIAKVDPLDKLTTSVDKTSASVNEFTKAKRKAGQTAKDADNKARLANLRYGEALQRSNTSQSTLLSLQLAHNKATRDAANAKAGLDIANQRESAQISDLRKRRLELKEATSLLAEAQNSAAMSHQKLTDRFKMWRQGRGTGVNLEVEVAPGSFERLGSMIERNTAALRNKYGIEIDVDVDRGVLRNVAARIRNAFRSDPATGLQSAIGGVASAFGRLAGKIVGLIPGTWVILGALAAIAVTTFGPLIASMTQVLGLLAAIPAAAMAAAGAIAAIAVGSMGVFKALGAGFKAKPGGAAAGAGNGRQLERAQKQAARSAADGARQIADAERGLARAQKQAQKAQEDLSEARREAADDIEDLNQQLRDSQLDEEGAILGVRRAYESLREVMGSGDSSTLDRAEARHNYKESIARLEGVRRENKDLAEQVEETNRAGVDGHDKVVSAQERVESSAESVADAQRGVEDAMRSAARASEDAADSLADAAVAGAAGAAAVDEYAEALDSLSPSARNFVETVMRLRDAWGEVRLATQEALFKGMGPAFERFSNTYIPILRDGLSGIAGAFNTGFLAMFDDLERSGVTASWSAIFANLAEATLPLMDGIRNVAEIFTDMALIGSSYFPEIAGHFRDWTAGIRDFINEKPERVHEWIQDGIIAFGKLKETTKQVLRLIHAIFSPGTPEGDKMWDSINETLERWADTLGKKENRDALISFFNDAKTLAKDIKDIIEGIAMVSRGLVTARDVIVGKEEERAPGEPMATQKPGGRASDFSFREWRDKTNADNEAMGVPKVQDAGVLTALDLLWRPLAKGGQWAVDGMFGEGQTAGGGAGGTFGEPSQSDQGQKPDMSDEDLYGAMRNAPREGGGFGAFDAGAWAESFSAAGASISETWTNVITPVKDGWNSGWETAGTKFGEFKTGVSTKWAELSTGVKTWYDTTIQPTLSRFGLDTESLKNGNGIAANIMRGDWQGLGGNIKDIVDNNVGPTLERMKGFGTGVKDKFHEIVGGIKNKWTELKGGTATVVNWVIDNVFNGGIVNAWDKAADFLPLEKSKSKMERIPGYRTGGRVDGEGTGTSDSILARLSKGEHVWDNMDVRRAGGHRSVYAIRALIEKGVPFSWDAVKGLAARGRQGINDFAAGRGDPGLPGFARGGAVDTDRPMWMTQLERGHEFARSVDGRPYLAGNQFPNGADCSGYMAAIAGAITDDNSRAHWTTVAFPGSQAGSVVAAGQNWSGGLGQGMSIGMSGGPASGGQNGHTAGTLSAVGPYSAVNVESGGGHGRVAYGGPAAGADHGQFGTQYHLAIGADGAFESAGGPSPEAQKGVLRKLLEEIFGKIIDPVGAAIRTGFSSPPRLEEVPGAMFDTTAEGIHDKTFGVVENLGDALRAVYEKAQGLKEVIGNVVSNVASFGGGLLRDTGGILPMGTSLIRNETGKPEQILNWGQIEAIQGVMRDAMRVVRGLGVQFDRQADAELIAEAIGRRLDETDWEQVAFRLEAFTVSADKIFRTAGDSVADDALGVFGVKSGRKRLEEYQNLGRALSGEGAGDIAGVPTPDSVIGGATGMSGRALPTMTSESMKLETKVPNIEATPSGGGGGVKDAVKAQFAKRGWDKEPYWSAVDWIVGKESTWNPTISNPSSGAFGLFQFLGSTKDQYLPSMSPDPSIQGAAGAKYIADRYGDPLKAKAFWEQNGWYDKGGVLKPGRTLAQNDSGKNELILNNRAWRDMSTTVTQAARMAELAPSYVPPGTGGGETTINIQAMDVPGAVAAFRREDARKAQMRVGIR